MNLTMIHSIGGSAEHIFLFNTMDYLRKTGHSNCLIPNNVHMTDLLKPSHNVSGSPGYNDTQKRERCAERAQKPLPGPRPSS
jgi:hypothetical protein